MNAAAVMNRIDAASPRLKARIAGGLYLFSLIAAACAELFLRGPMNVGVALVAVAGMAAMTVLFYTIFKAVNRNLSMLAAIASFAGLMFEAFRSQPGGVNVAIVLSGFYCLLIGYLMFRSAFLPRALGALMVFAGLGWLTFVSPPLASHLSPYNLASGILGQGLVYLWLLVMGVNAQRWKEQAGTPRAPGA